MAVANLERLIDDRAAAIAAATRDTAARAQSEEDIRHGVNRLLDDFIDAAGLDLEGRHEYGLAGGRVDSKYSGVIIEYKNPKGRDAVGPTATAAGTVRLVEQLKGRFHDFAEEEGVPEERLFGVGTDGQRIVFVRATRGELYASRPQDVTQATISRVLRALVSIGARGKSFTPQNLAHDFGSTSELGKRAVLALCKTLKSTESEKTKAFFQQWRILFAEVCGHDVVEDSKKLEDLGALYGASKEFDPPILLFSVHSYYAFVMKVLAAELTSTYSPIGVSIIRKCVEAGTDEALKRELARLEEGGVWRHLGIKNFLEGDLFSWYLASWTSEIASVLRTTLELLDQYDPATLSVDPDESRDLLKQLYQDLIPQTVRHDLGEYYTPDWLAEHTLSGTGFDGDPTTRLLDPACGSGTFLLAVIARMREWFNRNRHSCGFAEDRLAQLILSNVVGFDLNPVAVLASRTNFLIAIRDLLPYLGEVELPVYLCDAIVTPADYSGGAATFNYREVPTAVADFKIPKAVVADRETLATYAELLAFCVENEYETTEFLQRCEDEGLDISDRRLHERVFEKLVELEAEDRNGVWARIIKNAFAPLFIQEVDIVTGNPPWINWEHLPGEYRDTQKPLWERYGLFSLTGTAARYGGGKKDISMLFVYACMDRYLRQGGVLGFVITQTVFKSKDAGQGFRRFRYRVGDKEHYIIPIHVDDLSKMRPFRDATNRTAVLVAKKGSEPVEYPVSYLEWRVDEGKSLSEEMELGEVIENVTQERLEAIPVDHNDKTAPWSTVPRGIGKIIEALLGPSPYTAHAGACTWLNGVYWVEVLSDPEEEKVVIKNRVDTGRKELPSITHAVEKQLVYPLLRGRDVERWRAQPSLHIILTQDPDSRSGIAESTMKRKFPEGFAFLRNFEEELRKRSGYKKYFSTTDPYWSIYNVGSYTMREWKLVWREQSSKFQAAVIGPLDDKPVIPDHKLMLVGCDTEAEAHYLAGMLNATISRVVIESYVLSTSTSTHVLEYLNIPSFDPRNSIHRTVSELSIKCHSAVEANAEDELKAQSMELDRSVAELWKIPAKELDAIYAASES